MTNEESYFGFIYYSTQEKTQKLKSYIDYCEAHLLRGKPALDALPQFNLTTNDIPTYIYKRYLRPY